MEGTPQEIDYEQIKKEIQVDGVLKIHDMHVWALTPQQWILTAHIVISKLTPRRPICCINLLHYKRLRIELEFSV